MTPFIYPPGPPFLGTSAMVVVQATGEPGLEEPNSAYSNDSNNVGTAEHMRESSTPIAACLNAAPTMAGQWLNSSSLGGFFPLASPQSNGGASLLPLLPLPPPFPPVMFPMFPSPYNPFRANNIPIVNSACGLDMAPNKLPSQPIFPPDADTEQKRQEREAKSQHYMECLKSYLQSCPHHRCTLDDFVGAYATLPQVVNMSTKEDGPIFPALTKKNRGDLVRLIKRHKEFKLTSITQVGENGSSTKGCIIELDPLHHIFVSTEVPSTSSSFDDSCGFYGISDRSEQNALYRAVGMSLSDNSADSSLGNESVMSVDQDSKEQQLTELVIQHMQSPALNPHQGSVSVEKIQNIALSKHDPLYSDVVGRKHNSWKEFVERHANIFELINAPDGKLRMRLLEHTDWEDGDLREQHDRETKEQHYVDCLTAFLQSRPSKQCTVDEFIEEYPSLPQNQIIQSFSMGDSDTPAFPALSKKNRGDLVRLIQRHREFRYSRNNPNNTIVLIDEALRDMDEQSLPSQEPYLSDSDPVNLQPYSPATLEVLLPSNSPGLTATAFPMV
jgi:hypothetical protein